MSHITRLPPTSMNKSHLHAFSNTLSTPTQDADHSFSYFLFLVGTRFFTSLLVFIMLFNVIFFFSLLFLFNWRLVFQYTLSTSTFSFHIISKEKAEMFFPYLNELSYNANFVWELWEIEDVDAFFVRFLFPALVNDDACLFNWCFFSK